MIFFDELPYRYAFEITMMMIFAATMMRDAAMIRHADIVYAIAAADAAVLPCRLFHYAYAEAYFLPEVCRALYAMPMPY